MHAILAHLNQDHGNVARLLEIFEREHRAHERGDPPNLPLLTQIMHYLTRYQDVFHHPREDVLFDRLAHRSAESAKVVAELKDEHVQLAEIGLRLVEVMTWEPAGSSVTADSLADYMTRLAAHMNRESAEVFSLSSIVLSRQDWQKIEDTTRRASDPVFGPRVEKSYRLVLERLTQDQSR